MTELYWFYHGTKFLFKLFSVKPKIAWGDLTAIGLVLRDEREKKGLTTRAFATKLGCTHSHVVKIENGDQRIPLDEFLAWCMALEANPSDVVSKIVENGEPG